MLFQINLIKDRVVPRNLQLKRVIIAGSEIGMVVLVALIILFMGLRLQPQINEATTLLKETKDNLKRVEASFQESERKELERAEAQKKKAELFRMWNTPINFGVALELMYDLILKPDGYKGDDVRVRKIVFGEPLKDPNSPRYRPPLVERNKLRIIYVLRNIIDFPAFEKNVVKLAGEKGKVTTDYAKRGAFKGPETTKRLQFTDTDERTDQPEVYEPEGSMCFAELVFMPANESFYNPPK